MKRINPYSEFLVPCSAVDRCVYVTSSNQFHGLISILGFAWGIAEEDKQDLGEALLEEIFFCGYDFYDDWYPILSKIRVIDIKDWLAGTREGILFPGYDPAVYFNGLAGGVNYRRRWCKDPSHSMRITQISEMIQSLWGMDDVMETGAYCGWDGILIHNHERKAIIDVAVFPWNLSAGLIDKVHFPSRKIRAMQSICKCYGLVPIQVVDTMSGIYWTNIAKAAIMTTGKLLITASGLPSDEEESVGIGLQELRPLGDLNVFFKEIRNVDVQEG